jgi:site-specific DNA-methyltransferase (adenine-specific)
VAGYIAASQSVHWNTLESDLELVREVFGGAIYTDPCSNYGSTVGATFEYTAEDDGLAHPWFRNFFCNPPFGTLAPLFFARALSELAIGRCTEGIFFVPSRVDTRWFHAYAMQASAICVVKGRRKFRHVDSDTAAEASAPFPVLFIYFGPNADKFAEVFESEGVIFRPTKKQRLKAKKLADSMATMTKKIDAKLEENIAMSLDMKRYFRKLVKEEVAKQLEAALAAAPKKTTKRKKAKNLVKSKDANKFATRVHKAVDKLCGGKKARNPKNVEAVSGKSCSMVEICKALRMKDAGATEKQKIRRVLANSDKIGQVGTTRTSRYYLRA